MSFLWEPVENRRLLLFRRKGSASRDAGKGDGTDASAAEPAGSGKKAKVPYQSKAEVNGRMADGKAETGLGDAGERRFFDG